MRRALLALALLPFVLLAGCNMDPYAGVPQDDQQAPASIQTVSLDEEGPRDWIKIQMHEQEEGQDSYSFDEVHVRIAAPGSMEREGFACTSPEGTWHDGCDRAFQEGDQLEVGDDLWVPCASAGNHRVTIELGLNVVDGPVECEAGAGQMGPENAEIQASTHDSDGDGDVDWFELVLEDGDNAPYEASQVRASIEGPDGDTREDRVCLTDQGSWDDGCEDPFEGDQTWEVGASLFVPCQVNGSHSLTVQIRGETQLDTGFYCDAPA